MTQIRVLQTSKYAKFGEQRIRSQDLKAGDVVDYPDGYAKLLVEIGMAELVQPEPEPMITEDIESEPEDVEVTEVDFKALADRLNATESAVKLAYEDDLDLSEYKGKGSGKGGRIVRLDVIQWLEAQDEETE